MKRFVFFCLLLVAVGGIEAAVYRVAEIPDVQRADARRYVSNPDGILSSPVVDRLDTLCAALRAERIAEVAVVAVDDIASDDVFSFAVDLFRQWGVGRSGVDNGLGVLLVKERREIRFVTGGGLEGVLPDALCKRIQLERMLPRFREGDYDAGMEAGLTAVAQLLRGGALEFGPEPDDDLPAWAVVAIVLGFIVVPMGILLIAALKSRRCPRCRRFTMRQTSVHVVRKTASGRTMAYTSVCSACGEVVRRRRQQMRDDDFHSGGGMIIGGGFGGGGSVGGSFGGGSFGGGGAGSRW